MQELDKMKKPRRKVPIEGDLKDLLLQNFVERKLEVFSSKEVFPR